MIDHGMGVGQVAGPQAQPTGGNVRMKVLRDHDGHKEGDVIELSVFDALQASWRGWARYLAAYKPSDVRETR